MLGAFPARDAEPEIVRYHVRLLGETTGPDISLEEGTSQGVTVTREDTGVYKLAWDEAPGKFVNLSYAFGAATPGDVAGHTCVRDTYDSSAHTLEVSVFDASDAAHDLVDDEYLDLTIRFQRTGL